MAASGTRIRMLYSPSSVLDAPAPAAGRRAVGPRYEGETIFGGTGPRMTSLGWSVFPQERKASRRPSRIDGETLKWGSYVETRPDLATVRRWAVQAPKANVALIAGPASGGVWALDIDVRDEALALRILDIAEEVLGRRALDASAIIQTRHPLPVVHAGPEPDVQHLRRRRRKDGARDRDPRRGQTDNRLRRPPFHRPALQMGRPSARR